MADVSSSPARKKKPVATLLAVHIPPVVAPALAKRGLSQASLLSHWPEIVGADISRFCRFERLVWPPRGVKTDPEAPRPPATLILRLDGAFAVEAQHLSRLIVERVNAHLGWRCVGKAAFRQGPLPEVPAPRRVKPPSEAAVARARETAQVEDEGLREALTRLGARVFDRAAKK
jgi:hypothetical protein